MKFQRPLLLLVIAALLPLVVLSAVLGVASLRQQRTDLQREAQGQVDLISTFLVRELEAQSGLVMALAESADLDGHMDKARLEVVLRRLLKQRPMWRRVVITDPAGAPLYAVPALDPKLVYIGNPAAQRQAVETKSVVVGAIVKSGAGSRPFKRNFGIRAPVVRDGKVIYVVIVIINAESISRILMDVDLPKSWLASIADQNRQLVSTRPGRTAYVGQLISKTARDAVAASRRGVYETVSRDGEPLNVVYRVLPGSDWSVYVGVPRFVYNAPLNRATWLLAGGAAISLLMAGMFLWLMVRELELRRREADGLEEMRRLEALGRMTGGVAHDFNNLLMIIQGSADLVKRRIGDPERVAVFADAILTASQRGQTLTRQLLAFARRSSHQPVGFDLRPRADDLASLLARSTRADVDTTVTIPDDCWPIYADPAALEIALINLAVNARDAMPTGGRLKVTARNASLSRARGDTGLHGDFVALAVEDTGMGIAPENLPHIFEPFFTTKAPDKGTGLGLSQVYGFARQAGGAVTVASTVGQGSIFTMYLPRAEALAEPAAPPSPPPSEAVEGRLLLVEDNPQVAAVTDSMLAEAGYHVTWASDGAAALTLLDDGAAFDVVLSDIVMEGGMSGLDLAPQIQARRPGLPIVLMTGYSEALATGGRGDLPVLSKPFRREDALAALAAARKSAAGELE